MRALVGLAAVLAVTLPSCLGGRDPAAVGLLPIPAGAVWERESVHSVRWSQTDYPSWAARVDVSLDGGASWRNAGYSFVSDGSYLLTVPADAGDSLRARVVFEGQEGTTNVPLEVGFEETRDIQVRPSARRDYTWSRVRADAPFGSREGACGAEHAGRMWLLGGKDARFQLATTNDVWSSADGVDWTLVKPGSFDEGFVPGRDWEGRHLHGCHSFGGKLFIVGGDTEQGRYQTDVWSSEDGRTWTRRELHTRTPVYALENGKWTLVEGAAPIEESQFGYRVGISTAVFRDRLVLLGGQRVESAVAAGWGGARGALLGDVWSSRDGVEWSELPQSPSAPYRPRAFAGRAVEHRGKLWVIGGGAIEDAAVGRETREVRVDMVSSADGASWSGPIEPPPFAPRHLAALQVFDDRLWVVGGQDLDGDRADVWYSSDGENWYAAPTPKEFPPRGAAASWAHGGAMFLASGRTVAPERTERASADVWRMNAPR